MTSITVGGEEITLVFKTGVEYEEYVKEKKVLEMRTYAHLRAKHGVWASNQDKYVPSREDLTRWDSKIMEDLYERYCTEGRLSG